MLGGGAAGAVILGYGGSLAGCKLGGQKLVQLETFFAELGDMVAPRQIGQTYLRTRGTGAIMSELERRDDLITLSFLPPTKERRAGFKAIVQEDFSAGRSEMVNGWIVARTEALLAAAAAV